MTGPTHTEAGRSQRILAAGAGTCTILLLLVAAASGPLFAAVPTDEIYSLRALAWAGFAIVGTVVAARRPRTVIAWLLIGAAASAGVATLGLNIATWSYVGSGSGSGGLAGYAGVVLWHVDVAGLGLLGLALLRFPRDRWPSTLWRRVAWVLALVLALAPVRALVWPGGWVGGERDGFLVTNPLHTDRLDPLAWALGPTGSLAVVITVAILINLVWRARRSSGAERHQMKWLAYAAGLALLVFPPLIALDLSGRLSPLAADLVAVVYFVFAFGAMATATGMAILRYRLYDIDRIASRTATYALLTLLLAGVYAAGVVIIGGALRPLTGEAGGDLIVAASTLAVAALFAPMRRRIQRMMDRRFNRSQVDAVRTVEAFSQRLRDEVHLQQIVDHLGEVTAQTLEPVAAGVWLRAGAPAGRG